MLYAVDRFTSPAEKEHFNGRLLAIRRTIGALSLDGYTAIESLTTEEGPALVIGGGSLALNGIDAHVPHTEAEPFDLDIIVSNAMLGRLMRTRHLEVLRKFRENGHQGIILPDRHIPLKVHIISSSDPNELRVFTGDTTYTSTPDSQTVQHNGVHTLRPGVVAVQKAKYKDSRLKDLAGVIKGHVVATYDKHPVTNDPLWLSAVATAINRLNDYPFKTSFSRKLMRRGPDSPSWLQQLIAADFDHPAFNNIQRLSSAA